MIVTYKGIHKVTFPIFLLPSDNWYSQDGLLFVDNQIVDDKNQLGKTLGIRRLQTPFKELLPLRKSLSSLVGILKQQKVPYIDTLGKCFLYEKTKFVPLKYLKIKRVELKEVASLLWLHGVPFPFVIPRPPPVECKWAGVLFLHNSPWLLYNYSETKKKNTRRKV